MWVETILIISEFLSPIQGIFSSTSRSLLITFSKQSLMELDEWLHTTAASVTTPQIKAPPQETNATNWTEIRLFLSSTFIDTQAERDALIKRVIPNVNRKVAPRFIRINPVDLRWGVLEHEASSCCAIQKTCLDQLDKCRLRAGETPWFLGLRTKRYGWIQDEVRI